MQEKKLLLERNGPHIARISVFEVEYHFMFVYIIETQVRKLEKIMLHGIRENSKAHVLTCKTDKMLPKRNKADAFGGLLRQMVFRMLKKCLPLESLF